MTDPTGLDYQEAYRALYPGAVANGVRLQDANDQILRMVDRGARLRRAERDRVKQVFLGLAADWEASCSTGDPIDLAADEIRKIAEEIR